MKQRTAAQGLTCTAPTRRHLLASAAGMAVALPVIGFPTVLRAKPERMTIPNPGGALEEALKAAYFKSFTEKTGIEIS